VITFDADSSQARAALKRLENSVDDPAPALKAIGESLVESTKQRIAAGGPGPNGEKWARNSEATMEIAAKRGKKPAGNRPLIDS
jgi:hypothetical protein